VKMIGLEFIQICR